MKENEWSDNEFRQNQIPTSMTVPNERLLQEQLLQHKYAEVDWFGELGGLSVFFCTRDALHEMVVLIRSECVRQQSKKQRSYLHGMLLHAHKYRHPGMFTVQRFERIGETDVIAISPPYEHRPIMLSELTAGLEVKHINTIFVQLVDLLTFLHERKVYLRHPIGYSSIAVLRPDLESVSYFTFATAVSKTLIGTNSSCETKALLTFQNPPLGHPPELRIFNGSYSASKVDVWYLGVFIQDAFRSIVGHENGLESLLRTMTVDDPAARPTIETVGRMLKEIEYYTDHIIHQPVIDPFIDTGIQILDEALAFD
jgi:hypothetical protein